MVTCCSSCFKENEKFNYCVYIENSNYLRGTFCKDCCNNFIPENYYSIEIVKREDLTTFECELLPDHILEFERTLYVPKNLIYCICEVFKYEDV